MAFAVAGAKTGQGQDMQTLLKRNWFKTGNPSIFTIQTKNQRSFPPHDHDFIELAFIMGGGAYQRSEGGVTRLGRGCVTMLQPGVWHAYEKSRMEIIICLIEPGLFKRELAWVGGDPLLAPLLFPEKKPTDCIVARLGPSSLKRCRTHLEALHSLRFSSFEKTRALQISYLLLVLHEVAQAFARVGKLGSCRPSTLHHSVKRAIDLLESDTVSDWSLGSLARKLNINPSYLSRIFREQTSLPPMRYLSRKRAERAAMMLVSTDKPVSEIAELVGWPDPKKFARSFKAHYAVSATRYRVRNARGN